MKSFSLSQLTERVGLHSGSRVDRVSKQTISWHLETDHGSAAWTRVNPNTKLETIEGTVTDLECLDCLHHLERHPGNLHGMTVIVADWKTCIKEEFLIDFTTEKKCIDDGIMGT